MQLAFMKKKNILKFITAFVLLFAVGFAASTDVNTLQYTSKKTTSFNGQTIQTESKVFLSGNDVKIQFLTPEKRTLLFVKNIVYVIEQQDTKKDIQKYSINEVPAVVKQMLIPSIFGASSFMQNLQEGFIVKPSGNIYVAVPKNQKNISKIEYAYNKKTDNLYYYKMFGKDGGLLAEIKFSDYKTFNGQFIFPLKIQTIINGQDGVIDDMEVFSRIKVNQTINKTEFDL